MEQKSKGTLYIISDGTGETASTMIRAALVQYRDQQMDLVRCKNVRTEAQVESVIEQASLSQALIVYTVVSLAMRRKIRDSAAARGLKSVDLLGPLLDELSLYFGTGEDGRAQVGLLRQVDEKYYKRIEAIEFTVKHDDGKCLSELHQADVILVGISRTSKTPLSIFLSHKGWKVANIPLVLNTPLPTELFAVDQRKIVGLVIAEDKLARIRQNRLEKFGHDPHGEYASRMHIHKELEYALEIFRKNRKWPVFDVTERALEETATEITRIVSTRLGIPDSVIF